MNTQSFGDGTIHTPDNLPTHMPRQRQLGDTHVIHGGEPLPQVDATFPDKLRPKGPGNDEPAAEDEALGPNYGGHGSEQSPSPEKNILQTGNENEDSNSTLSRLYTTYTTEQMSWVSPEGNQVWLLETESGVREFDSAGAADLFWDDLITHEQLARPLVPGEDHPIGYVPFDQAHADGDDMAWTDGQQVAWMIRNEGDEQALDHQFPSYAQARAYFDANARSRWLVSGQDVVEGWRENRVTEDVPRDMTSGAPGSTHLVTTQEGDPRTPPVDTLAIFDGSNAVGTEPLV